MSVQTRTIGNLFRGKYVNIIGNSTRSVYSELADDLIVSLQKDLPGHYKKTVKKKITGRGFDVKFQLYSDEPGIENIEKGRKANKKTPPPNVLLKWVQRKGLGANAQSVRTRRSLAVGIRRTRDKKTGELRTKRQSLLAKQKSIAFLIGRAIKKEGLPRSTGFPPSHKLYLFRDLRKNNAGIINSHVKNLQNRIAQGLNA